MKMIFDRKKLQHGLFLVIFLNSIIVMIITIISMSTEYWVIARPYRQIFFDSISESKATKSTTTTRRLVIQTRSSNENRVVGGVVFVSSYLNATDVVAVVTNQTSEDEEEEEEDFWPIDLYERKNCKRYYGKIRFGLFKGVWMFNYAYGCKNRVNRAYSELFLKNSF